MRRKPKPFSAEQDAWLIENAPLLSVNETAKRFNEKFGTKRNSDALRVRCNKTLKVHHAHCRVNHGFPIGTEINVGKYIWVKVSNVPYKRESFFKNWVPKHRLMWEQHHGKVPDGHIVIALDGNYENFAIDNLMVVTSRVMRHRGLLGRYEVGFRSDQPSVKQTALVWCEHHFATKIK